MALKTFSVLIKLFLIVFLISNMILKEDYANPYRNIILLITISELLIIGLLFKNCKE